MTLAGPSTIRGAGGGQIFTAAVAAHFSRPRPAISTLAWNAHVPFSVAVWRKEPKQIYNLPPHQSASPPRTARRKRQITWLKTPAWFGERECNTTLLILGRSQPKKEEQNFNSPRPGSAQDGNLKIVISPAIVPLSVGSSKLTKLVHRGRKTRAQTTPSLSLPPYREPRLRQVLQGDENAFLRHLGCREARRLTRVAPGRTPPR